MSTVLVTGGAGFIGSHLVERLLDGGAAVRILDNLSTGSLRNLQGVVDRLRAPGDSPGGDRRSGQLEVIIGDVRDRELVRTATRNVDAKDAFGNASIVGLKAGAVIARLGKEVAASEDSSSRSD